MNMDHMCVRVRAIHVYVINLDRMCDEKNSNKQKQISQ